MRNEEMHAIPRDAGQPGKSRFTGVTCGVCPGALTVMAEGKGQLVFECRIGHVFTLRELVAVKERRAEETLWEAVQALEEIAALLRDSGDEQVRAARTRECAAAIRSLIERADPVELAVRPHPDGQDGGGGE